jgi:hypothetical protein
MLSESARATAASEARFRVDPGAVVARRVRVVALDATSDALVSRLSAGKWANATFVRHGELAERTADEIATADLVVMIAQAGSDAGAAARLGQSCSDMRTHTATFVIRGGAATDAELSRTLAQVRPWSLMVVVANDDAYVEDLLRSFR